MNAKFCKSCGKLMDTDKDFCNDCVTELGELKNFSEIVDMVVRRMKKNLMFSEDETKKMVEENLNNLPIWMDKKSTSEDKRFMLIIDIGSTTTKAVLFEIRKGKYRKIALENAATTVEKPFEDVKFGIIKVIKKIEQKFDIDLLKKEEENGNFDLHDDVAFIATSSAGGGLQILVVGLTMFDSASSAKRAAFGSGGVILDTFAIDDKRSALEQMNSMKIQHPDIILFSGGFENGAISGVVRLAEILSMAHPHSKFNQENKIPLIFAGNSKAIPFIKSNFSHIFDLYLIPNIRPNIEEENLIPAQNKIHQLFMENVMEKAPGYSDLKSVISDEIIPTPSGVLKSLGLVSKFEKQNIMACDIGGATTDIYSNILGNYYRTVSGNLGMSYSISNILKEAGIKKIMNFLPKEFSESNLRNYVSNKMLFPTKIPDNNQEKMIEIAMAKVALQISLEQHFRMNFNTKEIGYLDKLKKKFSGTFTLEKFIPKVSDEEFEFSDINIMIGSGGIFSHTNELDSIALLNEGLHPRGITELWKDKEFLSPHLGKLSEIDEEVAEKYLQSNVYDKLALVISNIRPNVKGDKVKIRISGESVNEQIEITGDFFRLIENSNKEELKITLEDQKGFIIKDDSKTIFSENHILIDTRKEKKFEDIYFKKLADEPKNMAFDTEDILIEEVKYKEIEMSLPYKGKVLVKKNEKISPETIIGKNEHQPPKIYIIPLVKDKNVDSEILEKFINIKENDIVKLGDKILSLPNQYVTKINKDDSLHLSENIIQKITSSNLNIYSPVRGKVVKIDFQAQHVILKEVQDYSTRPVKVHISKDMFIEPKQIKKYLKKQLNDFVYKGEILATQFLGVNRFNDTLNKIISGNEASQSIVITSPTTGYIKEINTKKGYVKIVYDFEILEKKSHIYGNVIKIENNEDFTIEYSGKEILGRIGFGKEMSGKLEVMNKIDENVALQGKILLLNEKPTLKLLQKLKEKKLNGLIIPAIDNKTLVDFTEQEIGIGLTGNENIDYPVILLKGFGDFTISEKIYKEFEAMKNKHVYVNPKTQIRAGVIRPKIIIQE